MIALVSTFIGRLPQRYITAQKTCVVLCHYSVNIFMKSLTLERSLIMSGISKPYNNKSIIASQICFNNWLSSIQKSDDFRGFGNITKSNVTYFQKQCSSTMLRLIEKLM